MLPFKNLCASKCVYMFHRPGSRTGAYHTDSMARNDGAPEVLGMSSHFMNSESELRNLYSQSITALFLFKKILVYKALKHVSFSH